ncbi:Rad17 cell cycle checkpoint protein-domain-containing protein [Crucibulum laeve]|uniref:Rad17 cell cycle checkpoint protein-domain-containing protein n=1 Tax=Crucibulum laeve TaxID=68775 RepID=A0A5C3LQN5_9AGAR|nr:Rad17 cell cycle checkpoint protein-domain-containing protein [Crucibulum laeve]
MSQGVVKGKGKEKETEKLKAERRENEADDRLWVDMYEPTTEAELAVHVKKVEDVRRWISEAFDGGPSGKLKKYRRILALSGPAGTGKTSTVRVLAREMGFEILEWRNVIGEASNITFDDSGENHASGSSSSFNPLEDYDSDYESLFTKFETFLNRASSCQNIFASSASSSKAPSPPQFHSSTSKPKSPSIQSSGSPGAKKHVILLEDLPNILHARTQAQFHAALNSLVSSLPSEPPVPVIIIVSDAGVRGEAGDDVGTGGSGLSRGGWGRDRDRDVVDVRTVLGKELLNSPYVTQVVFNPIAVTLMRKALQALLSTHFSSYSVSLRCATPSKDVLEIIITSANGDIRSAIMALQFACVVELQPRKGKKGKEKNSAEKVIMEAITRREQGLHLFHLMGRLLYNKRKGDPPNPRATTKDIQKDRDLDAGLQDPPKPPPHLREHERRTSRVDVDLLYADSPIDSSLFSLYIHQNYTQFCDDLDQCEGVAEALSWVDSNGGEAWYQGNPHRFHLLALGTLHALPSPVPRRSQKLFKPEFFHFLQKEKDAWDGVRDARRWVVDETLGGNAIAWRAGGWSKSDVAVELGGILKSRDTTSLMTSRPPASHRLFSRMPFALGSNERGQQLGEGEVNGGEEEEEEELGIWGVGKKDEVHNGGWLEGDDIDDFE